MANETWFTKFSQQAAAKLVDWEDETDDRIRILLVQATPGANLTDPDQETVSAALTGSTEVTGTGYGRRDLPASGRTIQIQHANDRITLHADPVYWTGADWGTWGGGLVYWDPNDTDTDTTNIPIYSFTYAGSTSGKGLEIAWEVGVAQWNSV